MSGRRRGVRVFEQSVEHLQHNTKNMNVKNMKMWKSLPFSCKNIRVLKMQPVGHVGNIALIVNLLHVFQSSQFWAVDPHKLSSVPWQILQNHEELQKNDVGFH